MDLTKKNISIVGFGKSGKAIAEVLSKFDNNIFISDSKDESAFTDLLKNFDRGNIRMEFGKNTAEIYEGKDLIILSPGVSIYNDVVQTALSKGVKVTGEIEIAYKLANSPIIGVTGTNGKSTTASLTHCLITYCGKKSILAGNIGIPLSYEIVNHPETDFITAEISSFQLETINNFKPFIGIITNITPDHTDRHITFSNYVKAKRRLFENQGENDFAVLNYDDENVRRIADGLKAKKYWFSVQSKTDCGFYFKDGKYFKSENDKAIVLPDAALSNLPGIHNCQNILAALCVCDILKLDLEQAAKATAFYKPLSHRMEFAGSIKGVDFYDDSKGTNPGAVVAAIENFVRPTALIVGGKNKGMNFEFLSEIIAKNTFFLAAIGESGKEIAELCRKNGMTNAVYFGTEFEKAIRAAYESVKKLKGRVLLSPAGASFDMFKSAEHRGDEFKRIVKKMEAEIN